jgi:hypothetical protein
MDERAPRARSQDRRGRDPVQQSVADLLLSSGHSGVHAELIASEVGDELAMARRAIRAS